MEDWQNRVVEEQKELGDKFDKLVEFTCGEAFTKLDHVNQNLLVQQASAMNAYNEILLARISMFPADPAPATRRKI